MNSETAQLMRSSARSSRGGALGLPLVVHGRGLERRAGEDPFWVDRDLAGALCGRGRGPRGLRRRLYAKNRSKIAESRRGDVAPLTTRTPSTRRPRDNEVRSVTRRVAEARHLAPRRKARPLESWAERPPRPRRRACAPSLPPSGFSIFAACASTTAGAASSARRALRGRAHVCASRRGGAAGFNAWGRDPPPRRVQRRGGTPGERGLRRGGGRPVSSGWSPRGSEMI